MEEDKTPHGYPVTALGLQAEAWTADSEKAPRFNVTVQLVGADGNAFAILGRVRRALRETTATPEDLQAFMTEATSGDYDHLLLTCMRWVDVT